MTEMGGMMIQMNKISQNLALYSVCKVNIAASWLLRISVRYAGYVQPHAAAGAVFFKIIRSRVTLPIHLAWLIRVTQLILHELDVCVTDIWHNMVSFHELDVCVIWWVFTNSMCVWLPSDSTWWVGSRYSVMSFVEKSRLNKRATFLVFSRETRHYIEPSQSLKNLILHELDVCVTPIGRNMMSRLEIQCEVFFFQKSHSNKRTALLLLLSKDLAFHRSFVVKRLGIPSSLPKVS